MGAILDECGHTGEWNLMNCDPLRWTPLFTITSSFVSGRCFYARFDSIGYWYREECSELHYTMCERSLGIKL